MKRKETHSSQLRTPAAMVLPETQRPDAGEIAELAYRLWQERGCPLGSPETDWLRAEELLSTRKPARLMVA